MILDPETARYFLGRAVYGTCRSCFNHYRINQKTGKLRKHGKCQQDYPEHMVHLMATGEEIFLRLDDLAHIAMQES